MRYDQATRGYKVGLIHDPGQFYPKSFEIEEDGRRLLLVAVVKRHIKKRFRVVAVLKPYARH